MNAAGERPAMAEQQEFSGKTVEQLIDELRAYPGGAVVKKADLTVDTGRGTSKFSYSERVAKQIYAIRSGQSL
jgi:hypothetical protein